MILALLFPVSSMVNTYIHELLDLSIHLCIFLYYLQRHESESESLLGGAAAAGPSGHDDPSSPSGAASSSSASAIAGVSESPAATDADGQKEGGKKKKNRCLSCKKKVGLTGELRPFSLGYFIFCSFNLVCQL